MFFPSLKASALLGVLSLVTGARAVTRSYTLTLAQGTAAPDGYSRPVYTINGSIEGPLLTADVGDIFNITIINKLPVETTIHWHGIKQEGSMWSDGVPGVTQQLIGSWKSFIYTFPADEMGIYWYHAHSRTIYEDGVRGLMYIRPKAGIDHPFGLISSASADITAMLAAEKAPTPLSLSDWRHQTSEESLAEYQTSHLEPICFDSVLINSKGVVICPTPQTLAPLIRPGMTPLTPKGCAYPNNTIINPWPDARPDLATMSLYTDCKNTTTTAQLSTIRVDPSKKWASFQIGNIGGTWELKLSIDGHKFWVYGVDGGYVQPQLVDSLIIPVGERYSAMVKLDQPASDYIIRSAVVDHPQIQSGYAVLSYGTGTGPTFTYNTLPPSKSPKMDYAGNSINGGVLLDPSTFHPYPAAMWKPPAKSNVTLHLDVSRWTGLFWALNKDTYDDYREHGPVMMFDPAYAKSLPSTLIPTYPVGSIVDMIIDIPAGPGHSIHKHGNKAWILGHGTGKFPYASVDAALAANPNILNINNPRRHDNFFSLLGPSWIVIRHIADQPSYTYMHCHLNFHSVSGMALVLLEGIDNHPPIPNYYKTIGKGTTVT